jgi:RNA polymerase sigma-70 factor (ECF subfamily)
MDDDTTFAGFIGRVRAGDERAARELVERYEPVIRREAKMRLHDPRLYRRIESADICQSVMASFFLRAAAGQYELNRPDQLLRLLVVMTRHKLSKQQRQHRADRRDYRLAEDCDPTYLEGKPGADPTPSRLVAGHELLAAFRAALSEEERMLADLRAQGCEWAEISARFGGTPQGRRMQLARAVRRVERQLEGCEAVDE